MRAEQEFSITKLCFRHYVRVGDYVLTLSSERELNEDELDLLGEVMTDTINIDVAVQKGRSHELERQGS